MPTISMREGDEDYAISFAVPTDSKGITLIYGRQSCDTRKTEEGASIDVGNAKFGGQEALVVLDETGQWYSITFSDWTGEKYDWVSVGPMRQAFLDGYTRVS